MILRIQSLFNAMTRGLRRRRARARRWKSADPRTLPQVWRTM